MNTLQIRGKWNQLRGGMLLRWSRLTHNRRTRFNGRVLRLFGNAQIGYGRCRQTFGRMVSR